MRQTPSSLAPIIGLVALAFITCPESFAADVPVGRSLNDCGFTSLYTLLKLENRSALFAEVASLLPSPQPSGYSMKELRDAASESGLNLVGMMLNKRNDSIDRPMIVFLKRPKHNHFVVIRPVGHSDNLVQVLDNTGSPIVVDKAQLFESPEWTGLALVPDRSNVGGATRNHRGR